MSQPEIDMPDLLIGPVRRCPDQFITRLRSQGYLHEVTLLKASESGPRVHQGERKVK